MHDLRDEITDLWRSTARLTSERGGRSILFMAARTGEGTSSITASYAALASARSRKPTWIVDLDLRRNTQFESFKRQTFRGLEKPGRALDASLNVEQIYAVIPKVAASGSAQKLLAAHQIEGSNLIVTRFRNEHLRKGQRVQLRTQPKWWSKLGTSADWIVVDAPSLDRSNAGLVVASQMDAVVIVMQADRTKAEDITELRGEIEAHGGKVAGIVMNRIRKDASFFDRLAG